MRLDNPVLGKRRIGDSDFTVRWIVENLERKDAQWKAATRGAVVKNAIVNKIGVGAGYVSDVYDVKIEFDDNSRDLYPVVLKLPKTKKLVEVFAGNAHNDEGIKMFNALVAMLHERECKFYNLYEEKMIAIPKVFATQFITAEQDGAILMEYVANGARCNPLFESFTMQQLEEMARQIAHLQAFSMTLPDETIESFVISEEALPVSMQVYAHTKDALEILPGLKPLFKQIEHLTKSLDFFKYELTGVQKEVGVNSVLVHGDLHPNNIFWKTNEDSSCSSHLRAIIDWQALHAGNPGEDLARILSFCADAATRREAEITIFDVYYNALKEELAAKGIPVPFTKEKVIACYKRAFIPQILLVLSVVKPFLENDKRISNTSVRVRQAITETLLLWIQLGLEDAIDIIKNEIPQWIN